MRRLDYNNRKRLLLRGKGHIHTKTLLSPLCMYLQHYNIIPIDHRLTQRSWVLFFLCGFQKEFAFPKEGFRYITLYPITSHHWWGWISTCGDVERRRGAWQFINYMNWIDGKSVCGNNLCWGIDKSWRRNRNTLQKSSHSQAHSTELPFIRLIVSGLWISIYYPVWHPIWGINVVFHADITFMEMANFDCIWTS